MTAFLWSAVAQLLGAGSIGVQPDDAASAKRKLLFAALLDAAKAGSCSPDDARVQLLEAGYPAAQVEALLSGLREVVNRVREPA